VPPPVSIQSHPMPTPPTTATRRRPSWRLIGLTALVLMAHWLVLRTSPLAWAAHASADAGSPWAFSTRTIAAPEVPVAAARSAKEPLTTPIRRPRSVQPTTTERPISLKDLESNSTPAPEESTQLAIEPVATVAPTDGPFANTSMLLAAAAMPSTTKLPDAGPNSSTPAAAAPLPAKAVQKFAVPPSAHLKYDVNGEIKGFPYHVNGDLQWAQDGKTYSARMEISHFLLGSRVQTSTGQLGAHGLEPIRFGDKVRSEVAAHFNYEKSIVTFSANTPDVPLLPGAQDQLSVMVQIAAMLGADPRRFVPASTLSFQAVGPKSADAWVFTVGATEKLALPGGELTGVRLWREPSGEFDPRVEIWFAPDLGYLPVRIRLTQANGDVVDQQWSSTKK